MSAWRALLDPKIQDFIAHHAKDDVSSLGLKKPPVSSWPYPLILNQIKVRQKAAQKSPDLLSIQGYIFPAHDVYEQASSQACALYKASLVHGQKFIDLTGGSGADAYAFARRFEAGAVVERDPEAAELLRHNSAVLKLPLSVHQADAQDYLEGAECADFIYIDPQRRDKNARGLFDFETCSPDILSLMPLLISKARQIMVKSSPVLDIHKAIVQLQYVREVHVVEWSGDCKEVLYILDFKEKINPDEVLLKAVEINGCGEVLRSLSYRNSEEAVSANMLSPPARYVYEPSAAFMKLGGYRVLGQKFGFGKLHQNSHLYTSDQLTHDFVGQVYEVVQVMSAGAREFPCTHAEISVRNFPEKVDILRKRLKLKDGGDHRIFATTVMDGTLKLILTKKCNNR